VNYIYDRTSTSTVPPNPTVSFADPKTNKAIGFDISKQWNVRVGIKNLLDKFIARIRSRTAIDEQYVRERSAIKNAPKGVFRCAANAGEGSKEAAGAALLLSHTLTA
jgi:hypothetical protein